MMLFPEIQLLFCFKSGKSTSHPRNKITVVDMEVLVEVLPQLLLPLKHSRFRHNQQDSRYLAAQFLLLYHKSSFNGLSHAHFICQQKTGLNTLHYFLQYQYLVWQRNKATFIRGQQSLLSHFLFDTCRYSHITNVCQTPVGVPVQIIIQIRTKHLGKTVILQDTNPVSFLAK